MVSAERLGSSMYQAASWGRQTPDPPLLAAALSNLYASLLDETVRSMYPSYMDNATITNQLRVELQFRALVGRTLESARFRVEAWGSGDVLTDAERRLGIVFAEDTEATACSPVMPTSELTRIRNNVVSAYNTLRNAFSNIGNSLDARELAAQYQRVFDAMEGGSYCYYKSDEHLVVDIKNCVSGANQVLSNASGQYTSNFSVKMIPFRNAYNILQTVASSATTSVDPVLNAFNALVNSNFEFHLHTGISGALDNLMSEYTSIINGSNVLLNQGLSRVQTAFEGEIRQSTVVFGGFSDAYTYWDTKDGATGYGMFVDNIRNYQECLDKISRFVVLDTPLNRQIYSELNLRIQEIKAQFDKFPNYVQAMPTAGFTLDPNTSTLRFYARQLVLNLAAAAGAYYNATIASKESLIGTGFSYQHGGKMLPHSEHKDGKDCDIFSAYFKVGDPKYSEEKSIQMATFLLNQGVTRLIYTNPTVVAAVNAACPQNAVAVVGKMHETHMHFDLETAS
jgi:hypothetical protein